MNQETTMSRPSAIVCLTAILSLTACGGGGGDAPTSEPLASMADTPPSVSAASVETPPTAPSARPTKSVQAVVAPSTSALPQAAYSANYSGQAYYVDSAVGSDTYPGTQAQPWKTLARAATAVLAAGDALLLKCGGRWRETVQFGSAFAPYGSVLIGGYGDCSGDRRPEIVASAQASSGWALSSSDKQGGIFAATVTGEVSSVKRGAMVLPQARHPNLSEDGTVYSISKPGTGTTQFVLSDADRAFFAGKDVVGARIVMRTSSYTLEQSVIASYDAAGGVATLATPTTQVPEPGSGYYLEGKPWMLDAKNEWLHDKANSKLMYYNTWPIVSNKDPIEFSRPVTPVVVGDIANVRIERIRILDPGANGLEVRDSAQSTVSDVVVVNAYANGIDVRTTKGLARSPGALVEKSTVSGAGVAGIASGVLDAVIRDNLVTDVGVGPGPDSPLAGIRVSQGNSAVSGNEVSRTGYVGISFANLGGTVVSDNRVSGACQRLTDCGGIYVGGLSASPVRSTIARNSVIDPNIANSVGAVGGAPTLVAGIYLDSDANQVDVVQNTISDALVGINVHNASFNTVSDNIVFAAQVAALRMVSNGSNPLAVQGNRIEGNRFFAPKYFVDNADGVPTSAGGVAQVWMHQDNAASMFSGAKPNVVVNNLTIHLGDAAGLRWRLQSGTTVVDVESTGWSAYAPTDTTARPFRARMASVQGRQMISNPTMDAGGAPWTSYTYVAGANVTQFVPQTMCGGPCAEFVAATSKDVLMQTSLQQDPLASSLMFVRYRALGGALATASKIEVREDVSPYTASYMEPLIALPALAERRQETFFNLKTTGNLRLSIKGAVGAPVYFDDVELYQVSGYHLLSPLETGRVLVNSTADTMAFDCEGLGLPSCNVVDERGQLLGWPILMAPSTSRPIFIANPEWTYQ